MKGIDGNEEQDRSHEDADRIHENRNVSLGNICKLSVSLPRLDKSLAGNRQ